MEYVEPRIRFWRREQTFKEWKCFIALCHSLITGIRGAVLFYLEGKMMLATDKTMLSSALCLLFYLVDKPVMNVILTYFDMPLFISDFYTSLEIYSYYYQESQCVKYGYECLISKLKYILSGLCIVLNLCKIVPLVTSTMIYIQSFGFKPFPHKNSKILLGTRDSVNKSKGYHIEDMMQIFDQHSSLKQANNFTSIFLNERNYREKLITMYKYSKSITLEQIKNSRGVIHALATIPTIKQTVKGPEIIGTQKVFFHSIVNINQVNDPPTP